MIEFGKPEKFDLKNIRIPSGKDKVGAQLANLEAGMSLLIVGVEQGIVQGRLKSLKKSGRSFKVRKEGVLSYRVYRFS